MLWSLAAAMFLLCGYDLYLDFVWSRHVVAPIRVDLLLTIPLAIAVSIGAAVWALRQRAIAPAIAAVMLFAVSLPPLALVARQTWSANRDMVRMRARPTMIFDAQFRNRASFETFFGSIGHGADARSGHFVSPDRAGRLSRAVVNDRGHLWLWTRCSYTEAECVAWEADLGPSLAPGTFEARAEFGPRQALAVSAWTHDRLTLTLPPGREETLVRAAVTYRESTPRPAQVVFRGTFAGERVDGEYVELNQMWLWEAGNRWLAYSTRQTARCGSTNDFVFPSPNEGHRIGDEIFFERLGDPHAIESFHIHAPGEGDDRLDGEIVYGGRPLHSLALRRQSILRAPIYEIAPVADLDGTIAWLQTVSMGSTLTWKADCRPAVQ